MKEKQRESTSQMDYLKEEGNGEGTRLLNGNGANIDK